MEIYRHLHDLNARYDQVIRSLEALLKHQLFRLPELDRFTALSKETRAATASYLAGIVETHETAEAGRRFGKRWDQQQRAEKI